MIELVLEYVNVVRAKLSFSILESQLIMPKMEKSRSNKLFRDVEIITENIS